ncbi:7306_t:CDS:2 [Acaulospora colombiana]|uniref:7306_t:CDS:1 n=1 Tax=Acaulospora colombiana TaxID=27376 RepID=A0ACA9KNG1_9GLOM|nr:7306_t:CDS:2 [Acaulospora colombiana]
MTAGTKKLGLHGISLIANLRKALRSPDSTQYVYGYRITIVGLFVGYRDRA